jgi:CheY-like chemotaxis protein
MEAGPMVDDALVLIVDDEADAREALKAALEIDGYRTLLASTADEALALVATHEPVCVILDLLMPGVGGAELTQRLRAAHGTAVVLIALTGSTRPADEAAAETAGIDYVLRKPLDVKRLRTILPRVS